MPGYKGNRVNNSEEEEERGVVLDEGDVGGDEIDGGETDDPDHNCCHGRDPETGVEDPTVVIGGHKPDDGNVEPKAREGHHETKGRDKGSGDPDLPDRIQPRCKSPKKESEADVRKPSKGDIKGILVERVQEVLAESTGILWY